MNLSNRDNMILFIARIMFVAVFLFQDAIYNKIMNAGSSIAYMASFGLPCPQLLLIATIIAEVLAGIMIISGWRAKTGAMIIFLFTLAATLIFHRFWTYIDPAEFQNQLNHFMKNVSIMGGSLFIWVFGVGDYICNCCQKSCNKN